MIKKIIIFALFLFAILPFIHSVFAQDQNNNVNIYFFWGDGCPHCAREKPFLEKLESRYSNLKVNQFEVWYNKENADLLKKVVNKFGIDVSGIPFTVIGDDYIVGYFSDETTGKEIENKVLYCFQNECPDVAEEAKEPKEQPPSGKINLPFFGEMEPKNFSLPVLTIMIGALDGFNPCAMWTLLFLISLLLGIKDRKRMWILGSAFIIASASVYFLFMAAWLNLILFLGLIVWIRVVIGFIVHSVN